MYISHALHNEDTGFTIPGTLAYFAARLSEKLDRVSRITARLLAGIALVVGFQVRLVSPPGGLFSALAAPPNERGTPSRATGNIPLSDRASTAGS